MWGEAAKRLSDAVNDELFRSLDGKSKHQLWLELCDIITKHPSEVSRLRVDAILRSGIRKFTDEVRHLESPRLRTQILFSGSAFGIAVSAYCASKANHHNF